MAVDGFADATILLDNSTGDPDPVDIKDPYAARQRWLYVAGVQVDDFDIEYRPNPEYPWIIVIDNVVEGTVLLERRPEGQYRVVRSANNDQATIALL